MPSIYFVKKVDNSQFVPLAKPGEPRQVLTGTVLGTLLLGAALLSAMGRFQSLEYGYRIERLEKEKTVALETNRKLLLEQASLGDPLRIDWIARNELGMKTLAADQIFRADSDAEPAPGSAAAAKQDADLMLTARNQAMLQGR